MNLLVLSYIYLGCLIVVQGSEPERKLYATLLEEYDARIRPVEDANENVTVYMSLVLQQIIDVVKDFPLDMCFRTKNNKKWRLTPG